MSYKDYLIDFVGLGISSVLTYNFYSVISNRKNIIETLKDTPEIDVSSRLVTRVNEMSGKKFQACVRGIVKALDSPIRSLVKPEITGVFWKHTIKERLVAHVMGFWTNEERTLDIGLNHVPFMLTRKGIGVHISNPSKLDDIDLKVVTESYSPAVNNLVDHLWGWMKGIQTTGIQKTEEMLTEGTSVMGVGQLIIKDGALHLEPASSLPYIVTTQDKQELMENFSALIPFLKLLSLVSVSFCSYFLYRIGHRWYTKRKKARLLAAEEQLLRQARVRRENQSDDLPESWMCVVCFGLRDVLLVPCQHVCVCGECALKLDPKVCPVCRSPIEIIQPVFYS